MHPQDIPEIPSYTIEVAQAVFPEGNLYMQMREQLVPDFQNFGLLSTFGDPQEKG